MYFSFITFFFPAPVFLFMLTNLLFQTIYLRNMSVTCQGASNAIKLSQVCYLIYFKFHPSLSIFFSFLGGLFTVGHPEMLFFLSLSLSLSECEQLFAPGFGWAKANSKFFLRILFLYLNLDWVKCDKRMFPPLRFWLPLFYVTCVLYAFCGCMFLSHRRFLSALFVWPYLLFFFHWVFCVWWPTQEFKSSFAYHLSLPLASSRSEVPPS